MVTTITDIRVPAGEFPLGRILEEYPDVEIELERLVPTQAAIIPLFWMESGNESAVEETLRTDPLVEGVDVLTRTPDRALYSVSWSPDIDALVGALVDLSVDVLTAEGTADAWEFRLQFPGHEQLSQFRRRCQDEDIRIELLRVYNPQTSPEEGPLTSEQEAALSAAYENGYWDVPRAVTQTELAEIVGISDNSLSQRLRRGVEVAVEELLFETERQ